MSIERGVETLSTRYLSAKPWYTIVTLSLHFEPGTRTDLQAVFRLAPNLPLDGSYHRSRFRTALRPRLSSQLVQNMAPGHTIHCGRPPMPDLSDSDTGHPSRPSCPCSYHVHAKSAFDVGVSYSVACWSRRRALTVARPPGVGHDGGRPRWRACT